MAMEDARKKYFEMIGRDEGGKFTKQNVDAEEDDEPETEAQAEKKPAAESKDEEKKITEPEVPDSDRERAVTALRREKVPQKALDALSESERVQWGLALAQKQSAADRVVTAISKNKSTETAPADSGTKPPEQPATTGNLRGLAEALALDEPVLKQGLDAVVEPLRRELAARDEADRVRQERDQKVSELVFHMIAKQAREALTEDFPELEDTANFSKVIARVRRVLATEDEQGDSAYADISDPMEEMIERIRDMSGIEFRESIRARNGQRTARRNTARNGAQPKRTDPSKSQQTKLSPIEDARRRFDLMNAGKTGAEVRAMLGD